MARFSFLDLSNLELALMRSFGPSLGEAMPEDKIFEACKLAIEDAGISDNQSEFLIQAVRKQFTEYGKVCTLAFLEFISNLDIPGYYTIEEELEMHKADIELGFCDY